MARNAARLKMGYYPLPESEAVRLRALLSLLARHRSSIPASGKERRSKSSRKARRCAVTASNSMPSAR